MVDRPSPYEGPERRSTPRNASALAIGVREAGRHQLPATLTSLAVGGCSIAGLTLSQGADRVWIRIPGLESLPARTCWSTIGAAGFAFEVALHPAVASRFESVAGAPQYVPGGHLTLVHDADRPASRREQIMRGQGQVAHSLLSAKQPRAGNRELGTMVRRHSARVVDQRLEARFPPPEEAQEGFTVAGSPAGIRDLSPSGLQVGTELSAEIGGEVRVSFSGFPAIAGTLVWVRGGASGVRLPDHALDLIEAA